MNIKTAKKIRDGRLAFPKFGLKKKGRNNFQKFNYFKLEDLIPVDNALCKELNLYTHLNQEQEDNICLEVYDLDQEDEQEPVTFHIPASVVNNGNITQGSQEHGNVQTYCWRYLLYQLWNVSESDEIDASEIGLNTPDDELETSLSSEHVNSLAKKIGKEVFEKGLDNTDKQVLTMELNQRLRNKTITNQEYSAVKQLIDKM